MRVDFYLVETSDGVSFDDLLLQASSLPKKGESRVVDIGGTPYRLQHIDKSGRLWQGDTLRIRMNDIPIIASLAGAVDEVDLKDDEGLGEETAFLYDSKTNVLAIQRNRFGMSASKFARYFEQIGGLEHPITPTMVIREDAALELLRLRIVRKLFVRIAGIRDATLVTGHRPATKNAIKLLDGDTPVMDITLGMGHQPGSLSVPAVRESAKKFMRWAKGQVTGDGDEDVKQVKVIGTYDDDSPAELDLLEFRMVENADVPVDARSRRLLYADRRPAIKTAFDARRAELERLFPAE